MALSERQSLILQTVVEDYVELGMPLGSKWIAEKPHIEWSPSTVRFELAVLEELGLLEHPHTSAGRVPTDSAYRYYAENFVSDVLPARSKWGLELSQREVDQAIGRVAQMLTQVTHLTAVISTPPLQAAEIKHIEVLRLQPNVVAVVVITSTGGVTRRIFEFPTEVDEGLISWAGSYFKDRLTGIELGARRLALKLDSPELGDKERSFLGSIKTAFSDLDDSASETVLVEGASHLLADRSIYNTVQLNSLMRVLEERYLLLKLLKTAVSEGGTYLRIGSENEWPELKSLSFVAANYGLGSRALGAVSVIGPTRMNYQNAINSVREAAGILSQWTEEIYQ